MPELIVFIEKFCFRNCSNNPGTVVLACNPGTWKIEAELPGVQSELPTEFWANLGYIRPFSQKKKKKSKL